MSARLICDICRMPKEFVAHYSLVQHTTGGDRNTHRRRYRGTIDLCEDCMRKVAHDGRDTAHKVTRIEMGRVSR